jgi:hypothetical protein
MAADYNKAGIAGNGGETLKLEADSFALPATDPPIAQPGETERAR